MKRLRNLTLLIVAILPFMVQGKTMSLSMAFQTHDDYTANLIIKMKAGNETILSLDTNPVITFDGEYLMVSNNLTSFTFPLAEIEEYRVSEASGVREIRILPYLSDGEIIIKDLPQGTKAYIYSLDGKVIKNMETNNIGTVCLKLSDLPKGTYIISAGKTKFKLYNK